MNGDVFVMGSDGIRALRFLQQPSAADTVWSGSATTDGTVGNAGARSLAAESSASAPAARPTSGTGCTFTAAAMTATGASNHQDALDDALDDMRARRELLFGQCARAMPAPPLALPLPAALSASSS